MGVSVKGSVRGHHFLGLGNFSLVRLGLTIIEYYYDNYEELNNSKNLSKPWHL